MVWELKWNKFLFSAVTERTPRLGLSKHPAHTGHSELLPRVSNGTAGTTRTLLWP